MWRLFILGWAAMWLTGCVTSGKVPLKVHHINSLASEDGNDGSFKGLEYLADPIPGKLKNRVNIIYLHGIGWTEDRTKGQLAEDFLGGIAAAYNLDESDGLITTLCGEAPYYDTGTPTPHIYVKGDQPTFFETSLPGSKLRLDELVCMDKQTLDIDDNLEFVLYRVFWDNIFWDNIQFAHVGQDDNRGASQDIAGLRRKYNGILKDDLVNYGFSDAVMYLGPAGEEIRKAIRGAMCSAALDAAGKSFESQGKNVSYNSICSRANFANLDTNQFAFVTESLGSKITFDVMQDALSDGIETVHDDMIRGSETYMLANQIALLSLSTLSSEAGEPIARIKPANRPKIVAMSELNDFLSYELVPFYEQLWKRTIRPQQNNMDYLDANIRQKITEDIGFEMIDMRLEFADKIVPMLGGFVDPKDAHSGHAGEKELMLYLLCGAVDGQLNDKECLATEMQD
ncbi:hypothetical protein [Hellea balneolensis]|uniref:hypothetical protein n=1 Tax=Hellea balneolensis TaxID=287478 RepID=UPI000422ADC0|nr:hypothetical protein [Hellea balneolensis]